MRLGVEIENEFTSLEIIEAANDAVSNPNKYPAYKAAIAFHAALSFLGVDSDPMEIKKDILTSEGEFIVGFLNEFALASIPDIDGSEDFKSEEKPAKKPVRKNSTKRRT